MLADFLAMDVIIRRACACLGAIGLFAVAACDGGGEVDDPAGALENAGQLLSESSSVRFTVEGEGLPDSGTVVVRAEGVAVPPHSFEGDIRIRAGALPATVPVVSIDGTVWAELPMTNGFEEVGTDDLGVGDPGALIAADGGVNELLTSGSDMSAEGQTRIDGDVYDQVQSIVPGELVGEILAIDDPDAEVQATWALDPDSGRLRQASLTGPFYGGGEQTYTVHLDDYDADVEISAPTG